MYNQVRCPVLSLEWIRILSRTGSMYILRW
jgi:hypothetical protein